MTTRSIRTALLSTLVALVLAAPAGESAAQGIAKTHLDWAEEVALNVTPELNVYSFSPVYVYWAGVNGATEYENSSVCNNFLTKVLQQAYGWDDAYYRRWMGASSPLAATYHDNIVRENGFKNITRVGEIDLGDILAAKYLDGSSVSGHVMLVDSVPTPRTASKPLVSGTVQYEVDIIDSTSSPHGPYDTRRLADGTNDTGAGRGTIRLYAKNNGTIAGWTWSTSSGSTFYSPTARPIVAGRLAPSQNKSAPSGGGSGAPGQNGPLGGHDFTLDPEI